MTLLQTIEREPEVGERVGWTRAAIAELFDRPLLDLLFEAQQVHREHHPANQVQLSTLLSIKTGGCPEDCLRRPEGCGYRHRRMGRRAL